MKENFNHCLDELLSRPRADAISDRARHTIAEKIVLVTGAGGSIGSALAAQILSFAPDRLILIESNENNLYEITQTLGRQKSSSGLTPLLGDICDDALVDEIFETYKPELVFHAAAFKHVPLLENHPLAAVRNNVLGTHLLARKAVQYQTRKLIMLSTDKAINPASMMGATKRIAELALLATRAPSTILISVRFGNVIGSHGSVIPLFMKQLQRKETLTVTHTEVQRYFLTLKEAVRLTLEAASLGAGNDIFVPDCGEPIKIIEVARHLIRKFGSTTNADIPIAFTGLRPGEKISEEFLAKNETMLPTPVAGIYRIDSPPIAALEILRSIEELRELVNERNALAVIEKISGIVPEYTPGPELLELTQSATAALIR